MPSPMMRRAAVVVVMGGPSDTTAPTLTIESLGQTAGVYSMRITASEVVTGFTVDDIGVSIGGSLASFATADNIVFTVDWTLGNDSNVMSIAAGVCQDGAGNNNEAATPYTIIRTTDILRPSPGLDTYVYGYGADEDTNYSTSTTLILRSGTYARRPLMEFDLSAIPVGATIVSAILKFVQASNAAAQHVINIHRILPANSGWVASQATHNIAATGVRWAGDTGGDGGADAGCSVSGTDYSAEIMGTFTIAAGSVTTTAYSVSLDPAEFALMIADNAGIALIDTNGTTETVNLYSSEFTTDTSRPTLEIMFDTATQPSSRAMVLFQFDDGLDSVPDVAYPYLTTTKGKKGTAYVISDSEAADWSDWIALDAAGWDIGNHTQNSNDLTVLTQEQMQTQLTNCKNALDAQGLTRASSHVAYPQGLANATVYAAMTAAGMLTGRLISAGTFDPATVDPQQLPAYPMSNATTLAAAKTLVYNAIIAKQVLIFYGHALGETADAMTWVTSDFQDLVDYVISLDVPIVTISELYALM